MPKPSNAKPTAPDERLLAIGRKLRQLRQRKGYTSYEKFAYDHDLPRVGYGNHEQGTNLTLSSLLRLLDIHNMTLVEFFGESFAPLTKGVAPATIAAATDPTADEIAAL